MTGIIGITGITGITGFSGNTGITGITGITCKSEKYQLLTDSLTHLLTTSNQEMLAHLKRSTVNI